MHAAASSVPRPAPLPVAATATGTVTVTLPDGAQRTYAAGTTGAEIAASIAPSLAKKALAVKIDGTVKDLSTRIERDVRLEIVTRESDDALELIRHDCAHIMAEAVQALWPDSEVTIGPAIDNGFYYDFKRAEPFTPDDLAKIEAKMRDIVKADLPFLRQEWDRQDAINYFKAIGEHYKAELIQSIPSAEPISVYDQGGWLDLCRGPHLPSTGKIGTGFKLMSIAGAYWRGDHRNEMLQRIYGTAWRNEAELEAYLKRLEEAEKRDHRRLGKEMDLFHFQEEAPGAVFWHPKGWRLFQTLIGYMRAAQNDAGYEEVNTPELMDRSLWVTSGHAEKFGENMFYAPMPDDRTYAIKPMNCPGHVQIFRQGLKSYRDLPLRLAEFGKVHRYEPSGALHGLMRVRAFTQDDAHVFCTEEQITEESTKICNLLMQIYRDFGFDDVRVKFSDRPDKRVGADEVWDKAEDALKNAAAAAGLSYTLNPGEGAFYGPKLEFVLRDAIGRDWQCGTLQVDLNLPGRLGASYIGEDGARHVPVMLHRAIFGSLERFTGILIEHYAGKLPLWLAPVQAVIATITNEADDYGYEVARVLKEAGLRVELDTRNEKINYKVREHSLTKTPIIIAVGKREGETRTVAIRRLGSNAQEVLALDEAANRLRADAQVPGGLAPASGFACAAA